MATYQKILVAVDLSSESEVVLQKAQLIAASNADIHLVYVQEPMDNVYVGIVPQSAAFSGLGDLEAQLGEELKQISFIITVYQDTMFFQYFEVFLNFTNTFGYSIVIGVGNV